METGSLMNHLMSRSSNPTPVVGMGATELCWTDRHPYTVVGVSKSGKTVKLQRDKATRTDDRGMSDAQDYTYEPDPEGGVYTVTLRRNGAWVRKGDSMKGNKFVFGRREEYHDFSF